MLTLIRLRIKEQFTYTLPMVLILLGAILFGSISSIALSDRQPEFRIAFFDEDGGLEAETFTEHLAEMSGLEIVIVDSLAAGEETISRRNVEALVVVRDGFSEAIEHNIPGAVVIFPAPGSMSSDIIAEAVSLAILRITTLTALEDELAALDANLAEKFEDVHAEFAIENPVLTVAYEGPDTLPIGAPIPARHGIQALFLLLATLHSAIVLPGISGITGRVAKLKNLAATTVALLVVWSAQLVLYLLTMSLFFSELPNVHESIALFALIVFNISLGAIFSAFCKKKELAAYFFIPYFLLNMTLGGGLWGRFADLGIVMDILLPVSGALRAKTYVTLLLLASAVLMMLVVLCGHNSKAHSSRTRAYFVG